MVNRLEKGDIMLPLANSAHSISPRRAPAIRLRRATATGAFRAIASASAIIAVAVLLLVIAADLHVPSVRFTGASLTVRFDSPSFALPAPVPEAVAAPDLHRSPHGSPGKSLDD